MQLRRSIRPVLAALSILGAQPALTQIPIDSSQLDLIVPALLDTHQVAGVGIAVIEDTELVWQAYYGEQAAGKAATAKTVFNTASVAKTITAETLIRLAEKGLIDLDEPIAPYVTHRDLAKDKRYGQLTARLLMAHRAGLLNWAYEYKNNRLAFDHDPDTRFSYSGAGVQLAAQYAQAKLDQPFDEIVNEHLLTPLGIRDMALGYRRAWMKGRLAQPMDANGHYQRITKLNPSLRQNRWQASDDLLTTVVAYAKFLQSVINHQRSDSHWAKQRGQLVTSFADDPIWGCDNKMGVTCPERYGHSVGWQLYQFGDHSVFKHSGNDAGENALAYFSPQTGNGAVIAVNGANGWFVSTRIMELLGQEPLVADYYRALIEKHYQVPFPSLQEAYPAQFGGKQAERDQKSTRGVRP